MSHELEGDFKVRAVNECGECVSSCTVKLPQQQQQQLLQQQQQQLLKREFHSHTHTVSQNIQIVKKEVVKKSPKFSTPIQGMMVEEGASVKLFGVFQGTPDPKITWVHKGKPLLAGKDVTIDTRNKMTTLTIEKVSVWLFKFAKIAVHLYALPQNGSSSIMCS